jgi:pSer/pThr/pTyr-binding forkhead associated (FHA) protein
VPKIDKIDSNSTIAFLVVHTEDKESVAYDLKIGDNSIGRNRIDGFNNVIIKDDPYVSRHHANLKAIREYGGLSFLISDGSLLNKEKKSKNGVYINGSEQRIQQTSEILPYDTIQIGLTKMMLMIKAQSIQNIIREVKKTQIMKTVVIDDLL